MATAPQISIAGPDVGCDGITVVLTASPGFDSYVWSSGETTESINVTQSGVYSIVATDTNGCTATANHTFEVFPAPLVGIMGPGSICIGNSATLSLSGSYSSIEWNTGETTPSIEISQSGTFSVVVTDTNGCTASDVHQLEISDSLTPVIIVSGTLCNGNATLDAGTGYNSYTWSNGATTSEITVTTSGVYSVTVGDQSGCSGSGLVMITIPTAPEVNINGPQASCDGVPGTLSADAGFVSYSWSSGDTTESIIVSATGTYSVEVTDSNGCTATAVHVFDAFPGPVVEVSGPGFICDRDTALLQVTGTFTEIIWSTGESSDILEITEGGTYSAVVTDVNGCTAVIDHAIVQLASDHTVVQYETCWAQDTGTVEMVLLNQVGCDSVVKIITSLAPSLSTSMSFSACNGEVVVFDGVEIVAGASRQFVYPAANGCDSVVTVSVISLPSPQFALDATASCTGLQNGSIEISVQSGAGPWMFALNGGDYQMDSVFTGLAAGQYSIHVTDVTGCVTETSTEIPETIPAEVTVTNQTISCDESSVILQPEVNGGDTATMDWLWSDGSTQPWMLAEGPGEYVVTIDDGCSSHEHTITVSWSTDSEDKDFFYIPNVFSPNGDGINDVFQVVPKPDHSVLDYVVRIFDRWGNLMFATTTTDEGWDGAFRGEEMQPGVYVWYVKALVELCGWREVDVLEKGDLTIIR
jgi:gliding motility-associated-like protein